MARVKNASGVKLLVKISDGASPEVFTSMCSINAARGITFSSSTNEFPDIDCADPEAVAWTLTEKNQLSCKVTGAGTLNTPDVQDMYDWLTATNAKNCQIVVDVASADGGVIFEGPFHCTEFAITGDRGAKMEASISLASDGEVTAVANT